MNLIETFQNFIAQVPELVQPLIVMLAAAVPFVEGEGAVAIGIIGGIHPLVAALAAIIGNFSCVAILVLASSRARQAIVTSRSRKRELVFAGGGHGEAEDALEESTDSDRKKARKAKFLHALERYGVPGVSLLGPLLLPTQFTATMLAAVGVSTARILFWQALAIVGWTTTVTILLVGVLSAVGN